MQTISHKRGDTFTLGASWNVNGSLVDLSSYEIRSQVRTPTGSLVESLLVAVADQETNTGEFTISASAAQTRAWPLAALECDIEFVLDDVVVSSETFGIDVVKDVTR